MLALLVTACLEDRPRPGPPDLTLTLDETTVRSAPPADTVAGALEAADPDGIDSVWVSVDSVVQGADAGFDRVYVYRFRFLIGTGKDPGTEIPVVVRARDAAGFEVTRDSHVVVVP